MVQERLILAIGRIERALSRLEKARFEKGSIPEGGDSELLARHEALKSETRSAIRDIDALLNAGGN